MTFFLEIGRNSIIKSTILKKACSQVFYFRRLLPLYINLDQIYYVFYFLMKEYPSLFESQILNDKTKDYKKEIEYLMENNLIDSEKICDGCAVFNIELTKNKALYVGVKKLLQNKIFL